MRPVGGTTEIPIDVRVIAATNRDLDKQVAENTFREDLYYRLSVIPVSVPPLRERREDIPLLVNHFLKKYAPAAGKSILRVNGESLGALCGYDWPGNVRQLENTIERAVALETAEELRVELPAERSKARAAAAGVGLAGAPGAIGSGSVLPEGVDMEKYVADIERSLLLAALAQSNGVQTRRRCAENFLPLVSTSGEEVRALKQLSAVSSQLSAFSQTNPAAIDLARSD